MSNVLISLIIYLNRFLVLFGLRKQQLHWGIVYDSYSKQPLDPVIVKLVDAKTGKVVQSGVTDMAGRYNFLAQPGKFKILVKKSNYSHPSVFVTGSADGLYRNLYHGEFFELAGESDVVPFNIPMDPIKSDWNQIAKAGRRPYYPYTERLLYWMVSLIFWFVLLLSAISAYRKPTMLAYNMLIFYLSIFILALIFPRPRWWGRVVFAKDKKPAAGATVELSYKQMPDVVVAKTRVQEDGKFFLRIDPGSYLLQVKKYLEERPAEILATRSVKVGSEHVVNHNFVI